MWHQTCLTIWMMPTFQHRTYMRKVLAAMMLVIAIGVHAHNYVVCVGISDYPGRLNDLRVSANDAMTINKIYSANGHADIRCLTNSEASVAYVKKAMVEIFGKAGVDDTVLFYFSGHGVPGGFVCQDGFLYYQDVVAEMLRSPAKTKILMADACYSGKMRSSDRKGTDDGTKDKNIMFFLSSRTTERSMETPYANSFFTIYLERGLRGGADTNRDKTITAEELYNFVHNGVVKDSKEKQHPVMWGNFDKNMTIIKW